MAGTPAAPGGRLKVGYVLKRFPRLSETFILNEVLELERQGVEVEIFSLLKPPAEERHRLLDRLRAPVTYLPGNRALESWAVRAGLGDGRQARRRVVDLVAEEGFDPGPLFAGKDAATVARLRLQGLTLAVLAGGRGIRHLHAHFGSDATTVALLASRQSGIPFSYTAHARDIYHTYVDPGTDADIRRRKMAEAAFVLTVSEYNCRHLRKLYGGVDADKIRRLYNGIDLRRFRPPAAAPAGDRILGVGRLVEKKGFRHLVEACRLLDAEGRTFRCLIVGDGPERDSLSARIAEAGLEGKVSLLGPRTQEELISIMAASTVLVLPAVVTPSGDRDGLPTVLLEALALGLPAISTEVAGIPEIIEDRRTGLLVPPGDPASLAAAIGEILSQPDLRRRLARQGRLKAESAFDLRRNVGLLKRHFERAAACPGLGSEEREADADRLRHG